MKTVASGGGYLYEPVPAVTDLEYNGVRMGERSLRVTIKSPYPVDFCVGDYIIYRDERFEINYDPTVIKKARRGRYGEGFVYEGIKFNSLADELVRCDFNDIVLEDNNIHYTALPNFQFFAETVDDLLDRIQANMDSVYGEGAWKIMSPSFMRSHIRGVSQEEWEEYYGTLPYDANGGTGDYDYEVVRQLVSVNNQKCWDALLLSFTIFKESFLVHGRTILVGSSGASAMRTFRFGKGNGLSQLENKADEDQAIVTRMRAYGTDKNLPYKYYALRYGVPYQYYPNVTPVIYGTDDSYSRNFGKVYIPINNGGDMFRNIVYGDRIVTKQKEVTDEDWTYIVYAYAFNIAASYQDAMEGTNIFHIFLHDFGEYDHLYDGTPINKYYRWWLSFTQEEWDKVRPIWNSHDPSDNSKFFFLDGVNYIDKSKCLYSYLRFPDSASSLPDNMEIMNLMLPGFPGISLYEWVKAHGATDCDDETGMATWHGYTAYFSKDRLRPYIDSLEVDNLGVRPQSEFFDGSDGKDEICPTIKEVTMGNLRDAGYDTVGNGWNNDDDRVDEIYMIDSYRILDDGFEYEKGKSKNAETGQMIDMVSTFYVDIPYLGFNLKKAIESAGADCSLSVTDGMLGGREFKIKSVDDSTYTRNGKSFWKVKCERVQDSAIGLFFPYSDYNFQTGDHFVLLGINLPDTYVDTAAVRLLNDSLSRLADNDHARYMSSPHIDEIFMANEHRNVLRNRNNGTNATARSLYESIEEGSIFHIEDDDLGEMTAPIDTLSIKENGNNGIPTYEITLKEEANLGNIRRTMETIAEDVYRNNSSSGATYQQIIDVIRRYGGERFLSKIDDDTANGLITLFQGAKFGDYQRPNIPELPISGAQISSDGLADVVDLIVRDIVRGSLKVEDLMSAARMIFSGMLSSKDAIIGFLDGHGISMDAILGLIQTDGLEVRGFMRVMELIINRLQLMESDYSFTEGDTVERVDWLSDGQRMKLTMHKEHDNDHTPFYPGDILYAKINDLLDHGTYYTSWVQVVSVDLNDNSLVVKPFNGIDGLGNPIVPGGKDFTFLGTEITTSFIDALAEDYANNPEGYEKIVNLTRHGNVADGLENGDDPNSYSDSVLLSQKGRQQAWVLSTTDKRLSFFWNVDKPIVEPYNYALVLGILPNLPNLPATRDPNKPSLYVDTLFYDHSHQANFPAKIVKEDRGVWTDNPTSEYEGVTVSEPYHKETFTNVMWLTYRNNPMYSNLTDAQLRAKMLDEWKVDLETSRVWRYGILWECVVDGTTQSPSFNCTDWKVISGDTRFYLNLASSNGDKFYRGHVNTSITPTAFFGQEDISSKVTKWSWLRSTEAGKTAADETWDQIDGHDNTRVLTITNSDMPASWGRNNKTIFTCNAKLNDGIEDVLLSREYRT